MNYSWSEMGRLYQECRYKGESVPASGLSEGETRQVELVWPRRENERREAGEEDYECRS